MSDEKKPREPASKSWLERLFASWSAEPRDRDDLVTFLRDAEQRDLFDADALGMIEGALQVMDMRVRDIMIPRAQMVVVSREEPPETFISTVIESGHSRFPVVGESRDDVIGILLAKDLLAYFAQGPNGSRHAFNIRDAMRPAVFVPESKRLNILLRDFRASRNHMAMVVDEYGGVSGLVTIEDVLEQIVGEIDDEHDSDDERFIKQLGENEFIVKALTPIDDFNEAFATEFSDEELDTFGGLVIRQFGHLPKRHERVDIDGLTVSVLRADKRRVHLFRVTSSKSNVGG